MPTPVAVRPTFGVLSVPETYHPGWLGSQMGRIARAIWAPVSRTILAAYTVKGADHVLLADATAGAITVTFPPAVQMQFAYITVKKIDASVNAITLGGTFDGSLNPTLATQYKARTVFSDGLAWYTLATV